MHTLKRLFVVVAALGVLFSLAPAASAKAPKPRNDSGSNSVPCDVDQGVVETGDMGWSPTTLSPDNKAMVTINISFRLTAVDDGSEGLVIEVVSITSSDGGGAWTGVGSQGVGYEGDTLSTSVALEASHAKNTARTYTIGVQCSEQEDGGSIPSTANLDVTVPAKTKKPKV